MKYSSLIVESNLIYKLLEQHFENGALGLTDEPRWIEQAFGFSMKMWLGIEEMANNYRFLNREEEIYFYKNLKPGFIGLIEYFTLLYKSVTFQPNDSLAREEYWRHELNNCRDLISKYESGCLNYEQQQSNTDLYFLQQNNQQPLLFGLNLSRFNFNATSYSHLCGRLIAMKRYKKHTQFKLYEKTGLLKYQPFFEHNDN